jgi:hypothetical protein
MVNQTPIIVKLCVTWAVSARSKSAHGRNIFLPLAALIKKKLGGGVNPITPPPKTRIHNSIFVTEPKTVTKLPSPDSAGMPADVAAAN